MTGLLLLLPKATIGIAALLALLLDSLAGRRARRRVVLAVVVLLSAGAVIAIVGMGRTGEFLEGSLVVDRFSIFADVVLLVLGAVVALAALNGVGSDKEAGDFYTLFFLSLAGASVLASAGSLIMVFLAIELALIPTFALVAFRAEDRESFEAALKYFLLSVFASAIMLFGFSLVYGAVGTVALPLPGDVASSGLLLAGIGLTLAGFGFKIAAFPFHQWLPDAFEVSHPEVAAFLAVGPKLAAIVALVRILDGLGAQSGAWTSAVAGIAVLSMVWGNLGAFRQRRIPRLLAYSAIAHAGYALVGIAGGGTRGMEGAVVYFAAYSAAAVGAFLVVGILARGGIGDSLSDMVGLGRRRPLVGAAMTVFMISMVGVPLFAGFWGKFSVFMGAVEGGVVWLAVVGVLNSAMSFGYYGNVIRLMYLEGGMDTAPARSAAGAPAGRASADRQIVVPGAEGWGIRVALGVAVGFTMLLGIVPGILFGALGVSAGL